MAIDRGIDFNQDDFVQVDFNSDGFLDGKEFTHLKQKLDWIQQVGSTIFFLSPCRGSVAKSHRILC